MDGSVGGETAESKCPAGLPLSRRSLMDLRSECLGDAVRKEVQCMRWGLSPTQKQVISLRKAHSTVAGTHTIHLQMTAHEGTEQ